MKTMSRVRSRTAAIFFGFLLIAFSNQAFAQGTWETKFLMPTAVVFAAGGVINGKLHIVGGSPPPAFALQIYDPATDTCATGAPALTSRCAAASGVIGGKLFVAGGMFNCDSNATTDILEVYDPVTDSWETKAPMPTARNMVASAVVDGKLYVIGGQQKCAPCTPMDTLEVYDPGTDTWTTKASMPTSREGLAAGIIDGKLYVVGGIHPHPTPVRSKCMIL